MILILRQVSILGAIDGSLSTFFVHRHMRRFEASGK